LCGIKAIQQALLRKGQSAKVKEKKAIIPILSTHFVKLLLLPGKYENN
jgi:hypothetical protein